ncbi:hypothetical protein Scep_024026 [Stephania cephalantha]|uniref:Uncharacterized protein n=1 Tax=Stephania cephalantha TaxID=152367 RepID=A0AAP0EVS6_9MAGN
MFSFTPNLLAILLFNPDLALRLKVIPDFLKLTCWPDAFSYADRMPFSSLQDSLVALQKRRLSSANSK